MGWLTGWAKRIELAIDYTLIDSTLTDFPVMLKITDESVFDEITSEADRYKIAVTADDGTTECYVEIERWDQANKLAILHACIPSVSDVADTIIYLYYDAGHADNGDYVGDTQIGYSGYTWLGDSFEAVFHMATTPTATLLDSTLNTKNATSGGNMTAGDLIDGLVGKAIDFDGQDDRLDLASAISLTGAFSISVLAKVTSYALGPGIACNGATWASGRIAIKASADALWLGNADTVSLTEALPTDTWFLLTITRDASNNILVYKNGTDITSGSPTFSGTLSINRICDNPDNVTQKAWYGPVDEFRIVSSCLSADWIKATYYSLINGLVKARDCGESWSDLGQQFSQLWIQGLICLGGGIALAGTYDGGKILRSIDYGANWSDLGQQASQVTIRSFAYCRSGIALAGTGTDGKILRSIDYGASWSDLGQQASQDYITSLVYLESGIALAGTNPTGKILRSTNYGANWSDLGQQYSQYSIYALAYLGNGIVLAGTHPGGKILRSIDYGQTWTDLGTQASQSKILCLFYLGNGIALAGTGTDGKILRSIDYGQTWTDLGQQYSQTEIRSLTYCGNGIALAGTYPNGKILRSTDYGQTWTDLGTQASQGQICSMSYCEDGIALAGTGPNGKILRSAADILRAEEQSIYSMPAAELSILPKHPIMIPFYVRVPAASMAISRRSPAWRWAINIANQHKATLVYLFQLGGWQDNQPDITIPVSSVYIRKSRVSARHLPGASVSTWAAGTFYEVGDVVRPTGGGRGFRYECIKAGWSNSTGSTLSTLPDWQPRTLYFSADRIFVDNNYVYKVAQVGRSGFSEPTWGADEVAEGGWVGHWGLPGLWEWVGVIWKKISIPALQIEPHWPTAIGSTINDNEVLWRNIGHDAIWEAGVAYQAGEIIYPSWDNGFSYKCVTAGTSGEAEPDWPLAIGVHITDGGAQWICYERTEFFLSTDFRVVIPDAATWAAAIAARPKGEMRLYRGYRWASDAGQIELLASIPLTEIDVNYETRGNSIALIGRDLSQTTYKGGEHQEDLEGLADYALVGGFARATCAINHFVRPGDFVTVEAAQAGISNTFEAGQIIINIAMRGTGIAESMHVEQWGG